jgi:pimeloyl-ACP methyl ester carboxylesterase
MQEHIVEVSSGPIRYRIIGNGPPVLFIHGLLVDSQLWNQVADELAATHRCILPDLPLGAHRAPMHADADLSPAGVARLVLELCDALDLRGVILVGNDSGGAICQLAVAERPDRIAGLVLTNCDAFEVFPPKAFRYLTTLPRIPGAMWLLSKSMLYLPFLRRIRLAYGGLSRNRLPAALLRSWVEPSAKTSGVRRDAAKFIRGVSPDITLEVAGRLQRFTRPAALVWGSDDRFFPTALGERLAAQLPRARFQPVDRSGTFVPLDRPDAVAAAIAALPAA